MTKNDRLKKLMNDLSPGSSNKSSSFIRSKSDRLNSLMEYISPKNNLTEQRAIKQKEQQKVNSTLSTWKTEGMGALLKPQPQKSTLKPQTYIDQYKKDIVRNPTISAPKVNTRAYNDADTDIKPLNIGSGISGFFQTAQIPQPINNANKFKTVYQNKSTFQADPFSGKDSTLYNDKPTRYNVVGESGNHYYYYSGDQLRSIPKADVTDKPMMQNKLDTLRNGVTQANQQHEANKSGVSKFFERTRQNIGSSASGQGATGGIDTGNDIANGIADFTGGVLGLASPMGLQSTGANSLLGASNKVGNKIISRLTPNIVSKNPVIQGAIRGASEGIATMPVISAYESAAQRLNNEDMTKKFATDAAMGGVFGGAIGGVGKGIKNAYLGNKLNKIISKTELPDQYIGFGDKATGEWKNTLVKEKLGELYDRALSDKNSVEKLHLGTITPEQAKIIKEQTGHDVEDFIRQIDSYGIRHIDSKHGGSSELLRGQQPITKKEFLEMVDNLNNIQKVEPSIDNIGRNSLEYNLGNNGEMKYIDTVGANKKRFTTKTMWKKLPTSATNKSSLTNAQSARSNISSTDVNSIPQKYTNITTNKFNLPDDEAGLTKLIDDMTRQKESGIKINLQLFAEAENKLKSIRKWNENPTIDTSRPTIDRIVSGQKNEGFHPIKKTKEGFDKWYSNWFTGNHAINKLDKKTGMLADNAKKVGGTVHYIATKGLVNKSGEVIGEPLAQIANDIPKNKQKEFWDYMLHKHNVARTIEDKPVFPDYTPEASSAMSYKYELSNPEFKPLSNRVRKFMDTFSDTWLKDTGLINETNLKNMREIYPDYIPTQRDVSKLESASSGLKSGFVDQGNSIKKATGSKLDIIDPLENIMNMVNRTVRTARKNEVAQSMVDAIKARPELNNLAEILPDNYIGALDKDNIVKVLVEGKPAYMKINDKDLLEAITGAANSNIQTNNLWTKGTQLFKSLLTQKNPFFAIKNIARDIPTAYVYGSEKNPIKFTGDLFSAGKDIATPGLNKVINKLGNKLNIKLPNVKDSGVYSKYKAMGGGDAGFFKGEESTNFVKDMMREKRFMKQSPGGKTKTILNLPIKGIEKFNSFTETVPRMAEFKRVLEKTGDINEALYAAGEVTTNFSRGGAKAKSVDRYVPYFNAALQGLDKGARSFEDKPVQTTAKGLIGITLPTTALYIINHNDPNYKALDNRTKDNYYCIAKNDGSGDFYKLPKSRELGVLFGSLFERVYRASAGEKDAFKGYIDTVATNFAPANPVEDNYAAPLLGLKFNKDFANRNIVPQDMINDKRSPYLQYDEKTSEISKKIGKITNISPKQLDYIIKSYTGVIGQIGIPMATKGGNPIKAITSQFIASPSYSNQDMTDMYDNMDKLKQRATDKNITGNIKSKVVTDEENISNMYNKGAKVMSAYRNKLNATTDETNQKQIRSDMNNLAKSLNSLLLNKPSKRIIKLEKFKLSKTLKKLKIKE